jgi:hypothetical protein
MSTERRVSKEAPMPTREHTDPAALDTLWRLPLHAAARWFDPIRTAIGNFFFGLPPVFVHPAIPHRAAGLCLDCEILFDTRQRQCCPTCAGHGWTLLTGMQRKERRGRKLPPAAAVVPIRRRG